MGRFDLDFVGFSYCSVLVHDSVGIETITSSSILPVETQCLTVILRVVDWRCSTHRGLELFIPWVLYIRAYFKYLAEVSTLLTK